MEGASESSGGLTRGPGTRLAHVRIAMQNRGRTAPPLSAGLQLVEPGARRRMASALGPRGEPGGAGSSSRRLLRATGPAPVRQGGQALVGLSR
jgi:hypothetical protein